MRARLEYVADGRANVFPLGATTLIGRISECDICVDDGTITRRHARVDASGDTWVITDLGSDNGTWVNGERIKKPYTLRNRDRIQCGRFELEVLID